MTSRRADPNSAWLDLSAELLGLSMVGWQSVPERCGDCQGRLSEGTVETALFAKINGVPIGEIQLYVIMCRPCQILASIRVAE